MRVTLRQNLGHRQKTTIAPPTERLAYSVQEAADTNPPKTIILIHARLRARFFAAGAGRFSFQPAPKNVLIA
jgi:hypothetical protein